MKRIPCAALVTAMTLVLAPSVGAAPAPAADLDCADFSDQASAQSYFISRGGPASDPDRLDGDVDGIACELNPCPCSYSSTPTTPPPPAVPPPPPPARVSFYGVVTDVIDGDTIRVRRGLRKTYRVRLIGIDTPEAERSGTPAECGAPDATSNMFRLGFTRPRDTTRDGLFDRKGGRGRRVRVTTDPTQDRRDQYGRLLAYVKSARGSFAGAQLRAGWATVYVFADPFEQLTTFRAVEAVARDAGRGAWRACSGDFHAAGR